MNLKAEHGNVLVYILVAVILFAALSYAVSTMMRSGGESIAGEKQGINASEVLDYSKSLRDGVQFMRISNGCKEEQISFERSPFDGSDSNYVNPNSPSDFSCHLFHPNGGGVSYMAGSVEINNQQDWIFTGANDGYKIGSSCSNSNCTDIIAIIPDIKSNVCRKINEQAGIASANNYITQENDYFSEDTFKGSYSYDAVLSDSGGIDQLGGKYFGCVKGNASPQDNDKYYFYQVLLAR